MAEFCTACKSLILNNDCTNQNCPLKIERRKKLSDKLKKIADEENELDLKKKEAAE